MLFQLDIPYEYERIFEGKEDPGRMRPDFSFISAAGDVVLWEHLVMLSRPDYAQGWEWKKQWYIRNGFMLGTNLFTTEDDPQGGLDSSSLQKVAEYIRSVT